MSSRLTTRLLIAASMVLFHANAIAEDIDLFTGVVTNVLPNVLFLIDNTANWNQPFTNEITALINTLEKLPPDKFNIGIMFAAETGQNDNNISGGYVRAAIRKMDSTNKALYANLVGSFDKLNDKGNSGASGVEMAEAYFYFSGGHPYAGNNKAKTDFANNTCAGCNNLTANQIDVNNAIYALPGNALASKSAGQYNSPIVPGTCAKNFIVYISNGPNQESTSLDTQANSMLSAAGGDTTLIPLSPNGSQVNPSDEWARFMKQSPLGIVTITIDVDPKTSGQGPGWSALLESMASVSGGSYTATSSANLEQAVEDALSKIQAVNGVFASSSLPVSVTTQGVFLNQVFIGMFRPNESRKPRWNGNLKQYQFKAFSDGSLKLADKTGTLAINMITGFITPCAVSYWTPDIVDTYWAFESGAFSNSCLTVPGAAASNTPDGDFVEKGAQGYHLRAMNPGVRVVKTCTDTCSSLSSFDTANTAITSPLLGVTTSTDRDNLINWIRGQDSADGNGKDNENGNLNPDGTPNTSDMRPSVHGDVLHSRPLAVDYGGTIGVVVFYGANDGMLRAVTGNKMDSDGNELWSFVAPEHFGKLKRLWDNSPVVSYPGYPGGLPRDYFFDGLVSGYRKDSNTVWIYAAMRRGGRRIYAFDVSNPSSPSLKWRKGCPNLDNDTDCDTSFTGIGQTWSEAKVFKVADTSDPPVPKPVLMIGGGYDVCEDTEPNTCMSPKGNHIFVLNADTGELLKTLNTTRSVAADITVLDQNNDGLADLAYAVDTGGNIYRINIGTASPDGWGITQVAALGCDSPPCAAGTYNRKFLQAPEVVVTKEFNAILVGSGDREHPLLQNPDDGSPVGATLVDNAFFMVMDKPNDATWLSDESSNCGGQNLICKNSLLSIDPNGPTPSTTDLAAKKGWYLAFGSDTHVAEQVVTSAVVIGGVTYFSTHTPTAPTSCKANLGLARAYSVQFLDASSPPGTTTRFDEITGGGLAPSPTTGIVEVPDPNGTGDNPGTIDEPFCIGCRQRKGSTSGIEAQNPGLNVTGVRARAYWFIEPQ